jgi:hypothetical protein
MLLLRRWFWVKLVLCLGMAAGMVLSPLLWMSTRSYPLTPVGDFLTPIPRPWDAAWFAVILALLTAIILLPRSRIPVIAFVIAAGSLPLWDQSRLQPWFYQYLFMLMAFAVMATPTRDDSPETEDRLLNPCRLIIIGIYFYSGLQKYNFEFLSPGGTLDWLLQPTKRAVPELIYEWIWKTRIAIPAAEMLIGLALLFRITRWPAVVAAIGMHAFILWTLGPKGHDWNTVVWPWNIAMMLLVPLLFLQTPRAVAGGILLGPASRVFPKVVLLLFGVLPLLSFRGQWDSYLSASLYSGNTPQVWIEFDQTVYDSLPPKVQNECRDTGIDRYEVNLMMWSIAELNVPDYPAERVEIQIARTLARRFPQSEIVVTIRGKPDIQTGWRIQTKQYFNRPE